MICARVRYEVDSYGLNKHNFIGYMMVLPQFYNNNSNQDLIYYNNVKITVTVSPKSSVVLSFIVNLCCCILCVSRNLLVFSNVANSSSSSLS